MAFKLVEEAMQWFLGDTAAAFDHTFDFDDNLGHPLICDGCFIERSVIWAFEMVEILGTFQLPSLMTYESYVCAPLV